MRSSIGSWNARLGRCIKRAPAWNKIVGRSIQDPYRIGFMAADPAVTRTIDSTKDKPALVYDGFLFHLSNIRNNGWKVWRCANHTRCHCPAKVQTNVENDTLNIKSEDGQHIDMPDTDGILRVGVMKEIRKKGMYIRKSQGKFERVIENSKESWKIQKFMENSRGFAIPLLSCDPEN